MHFRKFGLYAEGKGKPLKKVGSGAIRFVVYSVETGFTCGKSSFYPADPRDRLPELLFSLTPLRVLLSVSTFLHFPD